MIKIISIALSLMLLLSSTGLSYARHLCGGYEMMAKITLGEIELSCGMADDLPGCDDESEASDCCDNEYTKLITDDTFAKSSFEYNLKYDFLLAFTAAFLMPAEELLLRPQPHRADYRPPPPRNELYILYEAYLI